MKSYRLPFQYECIIVSVLCMFVVMCADPESIQVSIQNSCTDNIKLCDDCDHIVPGDIKPNVLSLTKDKPTESFSLWRRTSQLAAFTVTGVTFPGEDAKEPNRELIDITADVNDPGDPFDDTFYATPIQNYVTVAKQ